jgi:hypothetical protein
MSAGSLPEDSPLRRLGEMLSSLKPSLAASSLPSGQEVPTDDVVDGLWEVIRSQELFRDPSFQGSELADPTAQSLLHYVRTSGHSPELGDRIWLNRQIVDSALRQVIGKPCLRPMRDGFDGIFVSDAGKAFKVAPDDYRYECRWKRTSEAE